MKQIKNHIQKNFHKWKGKEWYHQRFDGAPYVMTYVEESEINNDVDKKEGADFTTHFCFFEKGKADWYILMDDIKKVTNAVLVHKEKDVGQYYINKWKKEDKEFEDFCKELDEMNFTLLSDKELFFVHKKFSEIYLSKVSLSSIIDGFALGSDKLIEQRIKKRYEESDLKNKLRFTEVFSKLTAPLHKSFLRESETNLCRIISLIDDLSFWKELSAEELFEKYNNDKIGELLKGHVKLFFWINNNYVESKFLDEIYFINEIKQIINSKISIEEKLLADKQFENSVKKEKEEILSHFKIDQKLLRLIRISEDFTYWQDERKKGLLLITYYANKFLEEISKRKNIPINLIHYMTHDEIDLLEKKEFNLKELNERYNCSCYYYDKEGYEIITGEEVNELHEKLNNQNLESINDFRGLSANTGKVIGTVKIIKSAKEISKVKEGDILVAVMTRTDYVPAMKRAGAIVTDEGGITSHAAIISRELDKPCIIGTKIATKVLKDEDLIEVDANHGVVKIL